MSEPQFTETNPQNIDLSTLALFQSKLGRTLYPGQLERLLVDIAAAIRVSIALSVNETGKQNLVSYAIGRNLDQLGQLTNTHRLVNSRAEAIARFTIAPISSSTPPLLGTSILIPSGLRVRPAQVGDIEFRTISDRVIPVGAVFGDVGIEAVEPGGASNGIEAGAINQIVDSDRVPLPAGYRLEVTNLRATAGGYDREEDEPYRERIKLSLNRYGAAGSADSYRFYALSASPDILDVSVSVPRPCYADIYVLTDSGTASQVTLDRVKEALDGEKVRPVTDVVTAISATAISLSIAINLSLSRSSNASALLSRIEAGVAVYATELRHSLSAPLVRSQLLSLVFQLGEGEVFNASIASPSQDIVPSDGQFIQVAAISIGLLGVEATS